MKRIHMIVRGLVQGVGFRYFAVQVAERLSIVGFVRNLPTGEVEIVAEGDERALEKFLAEIRRGPPTADVTDVKVWEEPPSGKFSRFSILPSYY